MSMPILPPRRDNLNAQLLVDRNTADGLRWSLMNEVDPKSLIEGKPLLQVFAEQRLNTRIARPILPAGQVLPSGPSEPWPDPRILKAGELTDNWTSADMWVAAHLVLNGPNPFSWSAKDGRDLMDFAVGWQNELLLDQLLRMPGCPSISNLESRPYVSNLPWLHGLASKSVPEVVRTLIRYGFDPNAEDATGATPLFHATDENTVRAMIEGGANPLAKDVEGQTIREVWLKNHFHSSDGGARSYYELRRMLAELDAGSVGLDRPQVMSQVVPSLFEEIRRSKSASSLDASGKVFGVEPNQWRMKEGASEWSLLGFLAIEAAKTQKKEFLIISKQVLRASSLEDLAHASVRRLPDLSLCWLAAGSSDQDREAKENLTLINSHLQALGDTPEQACLRLWESALLLDGKKAFPGKKVDEAIKAAWSREIQSLGFKLSNLNPGASPLLEVGLVLNDPMLLARIAEMPCNPNSIRSLIHACPKVAEYAPSSAGICLQALARILLDPSKLNEASTMTSMKEALGKMEDSGVVWDNALPDADRILNGLMKTTHKDQALALLVIKLQEQALMVGTAGAQRRSGPAQRL